MRIRCLGVLLCAVALLPLPCVPSAAQVPSIESRGYDFVLEIAGAVIDRRFRALEGCSIVTQTPDGTKLQLDFLSARTQGHQIGYSNMRIVSQFAVTVGSGLQAQKSRAAVLVGANLT